MLSAAVSGMIGFAALILAADADLAAFLEAFGEKRGSIETVQAVFVQQEISPDDELRTEGVLVYVRPRRILFRYLDPPVAYLIDGLRVHEFDPEFEQVQIYDLDDDPEAEALFLGFGNDPNRLTEAYDLRLEESPEGACGAQTLILRPRKSAADTQPEREDLFEDDAPAGLFAEARLTLTEEGWLPCRIEIIHSEESRVIIDLRQYRVNAPLEPDAARLFLPEGTRVIDNETLTETVGPGGKFLPPDSEEPESP